MWRGKNSRNRLALVPRVMEYVLYPFIKMCPSSIFKFFPHTVCQYKQICGFHQVFSTTNPLKKKLQANFQGYLVIFQILFGIILFVRQRERESTNSSLDLSVSINSWAMYTVNNPSFCICKIKRQFSTLSILNYNTFWLFQIHF